ncbi:MAG: hypothetical protein RRX92_10065, partial [Lachnospiraceae bacterium]
MNLWKRLFGHKTVVDEVEYETEDEWGNTILVREKVNLRDDDQRNRYVQSCLEQMKEASLELDEVTHEYSLVTSYLTDMEEIEALPAEEMAPIIENATKVASLLDNTQVFERRKNHMPDSLYRQMELLEDDMPEAYDKIKQCEEYQSLIRQDLKRLDGEKHAQHYQKNELQTILANAQGISFICIGAMVVCFAMLLVLQFVLDMNTQIGYLLTIAVGAITLTLMFVKHADAVRELKRVERNQNKLILLQNKVKIRYVNNTNLCDYLYMKYGVNSAQELQTLWDQFIVEREEREQVAQANEELDFYQKELLNALRRYHVQDPNIWLHQAIALVDPKEMLEIRHNLIRRRQKLRSQMEYNTDIANSAQDEIKDLVATYPE